MKCIGMNNKMIGSGYSSHSQLYYSYIGNVFDYNDYNIWAVYCVKNGLHHLLKLSRYGKWSLNYIK